MKRFVEGQDRGQGTLLPEHVDDYVAEDNPVRVIDAFVEHLDLRKLGFERVDRSFNGRPAYHPAVLLKIYIYGYLNRIQSSRRLEREAERNLELIWLTGRFCPDFKTIARFRQDNGQAIRNVCAQFVGVCRRLKLFSNALVAIDGSKFKAVNNRDRNFTANKIDRRREQIEASIERYLAAIETADRQNPDIAEAKTTRLREKIACLKEQMTQFEEIDARLQQTPDKQISLTDPDARSMATSGRGTGMVGYNVQTAVDSRHHLVVAHEVTNVGHDRTQLAKMAKQAKRAMGVKELSVVADRGYFRSEEFLVCDKAGITAYVPKPLTSNAKADGRFGKDDFLYDPESDEYQCPAGERLIWRYHTVENGQTLHRYWSSNCKACSLKPKCTPGDQRRISRWQHEDLLERMQRRLDRSPDAMAIRRQTVEHPFGTLKAWMGATHFLTKGLERVSAEMSLHVLAYNMKRVMKIIGNAALINAVRA